MVSTNYKVSTISAGGLEIPLLLTFSVDRKKNSWNDERLCWELKWL